MILSGYPPSHRNIDEPQPEICELCGNFTPASHLITADVEGLRGIRVCDLTDGCAKFRSATSWRDRYRQNARSRSGYGDSRIFPPGGGSTWGTGESEGPYGFGAGVEILDDSEYTTIQIDTTDWTELRDALKSQFPRIITWNPALSGTIDVGISTIKMDSRHSHLIVERWPDTDLRIVNDGHATTGLIQWGNTLTFPNDPVGATVTDVWIKEWRGYCGPSTLEATSGKSDNMDFVGLNRFFFEHMTLLATIDKLQTDRYATNGTFHNCIIGAGIALAVPPHTKNEQHNRTISIINSSNLTFGWNIIGIDDYRTPNIKSAGPIDIYGNVIVLCGTNGSVVGRNVLPGNTWAPTPATANYRRNKYITMSEWTGLYLLNAEGQTQNPAGAGGSASIYFDDSNDVSEVAAGTTIGSPVFDTYNLWQGTPHTAPFVPDFAAEADMTVEDYVLATAGLGFRNAHEIALIQKVRDRTAVQIQSNIDELIA